MTCPFLKEAAVKYCQAAGMRKMIPLAQAGAAQEKCSSGEHRDCAVYRGCPPESNGREACPFLRESLMQYCSAAPVAKLIPYSEPALSRCGSDRYRYCELYLTMSHPPAAVESVDGIPMPGWLRYTANHMWVDVTDEGICHAGIDAFFSRALGKIETVTYVCPKAFRRAAVVLRAAGVDVEVVFPNPLRVTSCNPYARANPASIECEPYTSGWLFEGAAEPETTADLFEGAEARQWMEREHLRMNEFLQRTTGCGALADGGALACGVASQLDRSQMLALFHEFFSPYASGRKEA